jgi:hypothetical protein
MPAIIESNEIGLVKGEKGIFISLFLYGFFGGKISMRKFSLMMISLDRVVS